MRNTQILVQNTISLKSQSSKCVKPVCPRMSKIWSFVIKKKGLK